jgi:hypothetical protein
MRDSQKITTLRLAAFNRGSHSRRDGAFARNSLIIHWPSSGQHQYQHAAALPLHRSYGLSAHPQVMHLRYAH